MKRSVVSAGLVIIIGLSIVSAGMYHPIIQLSCKETGGRKLDSPPRIAQMIGRVIATDQDPNEKLYYSAEGEHAKYVEIDEWGLIRLAQAIPATQNKIEFTAVVRDSDGNIAAKMFIFDWCMLSICP